MSGVFDGNMCITPYISILKWAGARSQPSWEIISGCGRVFYWNLPTTGLGFLGVDVGQCCSGNESQNSKLKRWEYTKRTLVWKCERANLRQSGHRSLGGYSSFTLLLPLNNLLPFSLKSQRPALRNLHLSGQPSSRYLFIIHLSQQTSLKQLPSATIFLRFSFQTN